MDKIVYERLSFCLLGVASPRDLIQDKARTPFNIGRYIDLAGITFSEGKEALRQSLAVGGENGKVELWKLRDRPMRLLTLEPQFNEPVNQIEFSPDGQSLAVGHSDGNIVLWSLNLDALLKQGCSRLSKSSANQCD